MVAQAFADDFHSRKWPTFKMVVRQMHKLSVFFGPLDVVVTENQCAALIFGDVILRIGETVVRWLKIVCEITAPMHFKLKMHYQMKGDLFILQNVL